MSEDREPGVITAAKLAAWGVVVLVTVAVFAAATAAVIVLFR